MLTPPANEFAHALVTTISMVDALLSSRAVVGAKKERLVAFRQSAAETLMMVVGIELPVGEITDQGGR